MSDRLTLSCRLRGFRALNMLQYWEKLLTLFPHSRLSAATSVFRIHAVSLSEPCVFEHAWPAPFDAQPIVEIAHEFQHEDCAYQLEGSWDLMQFEEDWRLGPAAVNLWCFGPAFEDSGDDHVRIEFGLEDQFLPMDGDRASIRASQENLRSLMHLVKELENRMPVEKRQLWSESGANFAEKLERALSGGDPAVH